MSTGMPRPLSRMEMEPSTWTVKSMRVQWPARYSSTELSSTSDLNLVFRVNVHRDAAAVIPNGDGAVHMDRQVDASAMAGQVFVHRIVEHFRSESCIQGECPPGCRGRYPEWRWSRPHGPSSRCECNGRPGIRPPNCRALPI